MNVTDAEYKKAEGELKLKDEEDVAAKDVETGDAAVSEDHTVRTDAGDQDPHVTTNVAAKDVAAKDAVTSDGDNYDEGKTKKIASGPST